MRSLGFFAWVALLAGLPALVLATASVRLGPGEYGVRQHQWSGEIESRDRGVGLHLVVPGVHTIERVSGRAQRLVLGGTGDDARPPIELRTSDDNMVRATVALLWRVRPGRAHELVRSGAVLSHPERLVSAVEDVLRGSFATLSSTDWFDPDLRAARLAVARTELEARMEELHLELLDLFPPGISFSSEYEVRLQSSQVLAEQRELEFAKDDVADAKAALARAEAETKAAEKEVKARWSLLRTELESAASLERRRADELALAEEARVRLEAERTWGDLVGTAEALVARATSDAEQRRATAVAGNGGRILLARSAARGLQLESVDLDARDPRVPLALDLDSLVALLLGSNP